MTERDRILAAVRGEPVDRLPWVPRLDLWYSANKDANSLPPEMTGKSLRDITDSLGLGYHAVIPKFLAAEDDHSVVDRALGIHRVREFPYNVELHGVERVVQKDKDGFSVEYLTPVGTTRTRFLLTDEMRRAGSSLTWIAQHAVEEETDYDPVAYIFEHMEVVPDYEPFEEYRRYVGERGVAVAFLNLGASPMHLIQHELMP